MQGHLKVCIACLKSQKMQLLALKENTAATGEAVDDLSFKLLQFALSNPGLLAMTQPSTDPSADGPRPWNSRDSSVQLARPVYQRTASHAVRSELFKETPLPLMLHHGHVRLVKHVTYLNSLSQTEPLVDQGLTPDLLRRRT